MYARSRCQTPYSSQKLASKSAESMVQRILTQALVNDEVPPDSPAEDGLSHDPFPSKPHVFERMTFG